MKDKEIIKVFQDIRRELDEDIVNDGIDLRKVLYRMKLLLIYCNISEKFRKNYCCTEEDIRDMVLDKMRYSDNTMITSRFTDAVQSKREVTEVFDRFRISFKFTIECYFIILAILVILSIIPSSEWKSSAAPDVCRAIICGLNCLLPLAMWRLMSEIDNEKVQSHLRYFLNHHKEWMWATDRKTDVFAKFAIQINVDDLFLSHDHSKYSPIEYGMRAIEECIRYNALQNIIFEDSNKIEYDDVTYMKISLSEEAYYFIIGPKALDDKKEDEVDESDHDGEEGPLFNLIKGVEDLQGRLRIQEGVLRKE